MKIQSLQLRDFKCFEDKLFIFDNNVELEGANGTGKSTIREAVLFALYNRTDATVKDTDKYIRNGAGFCEVILKADKGEVKRQRNNRKSELWLNGEKTTQENLEDKLQLPRFEVFNSVFTAGYFMTLEEKEQRQIILELTKPIDREEIYVKLGGLMGPMINLDDLEETYKALNKNKGEFKEIIHLNNILIEYCSCFTPDRKKDLESQNIKSEEKMIEIDNLMKIVQKIPQEEIKIKLKELEPLLAMTIPNTELILVETLKSEMGYKSVFKLLVGGKEWKYLSTGEKKKVDIGICELINMFYRFGIIFVDNTESLSSSVDTNFKQVFTSRVTSGDLIVIASQNHVTV